MPQKFVRLLCYASRCIDQKFFFIGTDLVTTEQQIGYVSKFDLVSTLEDLSTEKDCGGKFKIITFYEELRKLKKKLNLQILIK